LRAASGACMLRSTIVNWPGAKGSYINDPPVRSNKPRDELFGRDAH
jgi:hypothetical protein